MSGPVLLSVFLAVIDHSALLSMTVREMLYKQIYYFYSIRSLSLYTREYIPIWLCMYLEQKKALGANIHTHIEFFRSPLFLPETAFLESILEVVTLPSNFFFLSVFLEENCLLLA